MSSDEFSIFDGGETVGVADGEEYREETTALPTEARKQSLTELQRRTIQTAVLNKHASTTEIGELIGKSGSYVAATLRRKCPTWYYEHFDPNEPTHYHADPKHSLESWVWGREVNDE